MGRSACCGVVTLAIASVLTLDAVPVSAQWRLDAQAGRLQYEIAPEEAASSLAVALTRWTPAHEIGLATGVPLSSGEPVWAALHGAQRLRLAGETLRFSLGAAASGFAYRIASPDTATLSPLIPPERALTGWGASAELMPGVTREWDAVSIEVRGGGVWFTTASTETEAYQRTAFVADAALSLAPVRDLALRLDGQWVAAEDATLPYASVGFAWTRWATVWASIGRWFDADGEPVSWSAGASVPLGDRVAAIFTGRHDPIDPVYATPARTSWGAGVSIWLGALNTAIAEPVPAAYEEGTALIVIPADASRGRPSIAGDFNGWTPEPMSPEGNDWAFRVPLEPGVYNYAFVDEAGDWFVPEGTPGRRADGMGGHVAVLVVAP